MIRTLGGIGPHIIHGVISLQNNMDLTFLHFFFNFFAILTSKNTA